MSNDMVAEIENPLGRDNVGEGFQPPPAGGLEARPYIVRVFVRPSAGSTLLPF